MASLLDLLSQTWPARMGQAAWQAFKAPGDAYAGRLDPLSDEGIRRATDLAGMVMGGTFATAPRGALGAGPGIRAYHGSPSDFEKFDLSKVGKREGGGTTFSKGLYFAERPQAAEIYRPPGGKVYEVDLKTQPDRLLQWSVPEQSALVRRATSDLPTPAPRSGQPFGSGGRIIEDNEGRWFLNVGEANFPLSYHDMTRLFGSDPAALTGGQVYRRAASDLGEQEVVNRLRKAGVEGAQYPDEHRYAGTSNYAIYNPDIIDILRKYGLAGLAATGAAGAAVAPTSKQPQSLLEM